MKRVLLCALCLLLTLVPCFGNALGETAPDPDKLAYEALDILSALMMCLSVSQTFSLLPYMT